MVRRDGAEARKERLQHIAQYVHGQLHQNNGTPISLSKTVAHEALELGLRKTTVMEYLEILADNGQFEIDRQNDLIKNCVV